MLNGKSPRARAGHTCTAIGPAPQSVAERKEAIAVHIKASEEANGKRNDDGEKETSPRGNAVPLSGQVPQQTILAPTTSTTNEDGSCSTESNAVMAALPSQRLLIFGGGDDDGLMNDLHLLEVDTLSWSPVFTAGNTPSPRSRHTATLVKSTLWVVGGLGEGQTVFNDVYTLNTSSMVWSKPVIKGTTPMPPRWGHSAIRSGSLIIIFGGHSGVHVLNDLYILDTDSLTWRFVDTTANANGPPSPPLPPPNGGLSVLSGSLSSLPNILANIPTNGTAITVDGAPLTNHGSLTVSASSSTVTTPTLATSPASFGAHNAASASANGAPIVLSAANGASNGPSDLATVVESDFENTQDPSKSMANGLAVHSSQPPAPRCGHTANFILMGRERKMVIFGGSSPTGESFNDTSVLDLDTLIWTQLSIRGSLPSARSIHSCNTVDDKLFVIGGVDNSRRFKDIYTLSLSSILTVEDPGMTPIRGRPRRASRASPRVHTNNLASPSSAGGVVIPLSPTVTTATPTHFATHLAAHNSSMPTSPHSQGVPSRLSMGDEAKSSPNSTDMPTTSSAPPTAPSANSYYHPPHQLLSHSAGAAEMSNWAEESEGRSSSPAPVSASPSTGNNPHSYPSPGRQRTHSQLRRSMPVSSTSSHAFLQTAVHRSQAHHSTLTSPASSPSPTPVDSIGVSGSAPTGFMTPQKDVSHDPSATASPISAFLTQLGLSRLVPKFEQEEIDLSVLPYLTEENLEFLGVNTLGARLRLGNAIQTLRTSSAASSMPGTPTSFQALAHFAPQPPLTPTAFSALQAHSLASSPAPSALSSPHHSTAPSTEALEASVERLVSTVLVATNTLTETMHFITNKLTQQQQLPQSPHSPAPTLLHPSQHALVTPSSPTLSGRNGQRRSSLLEVGPSQ